MNLVGFLIHEKLLNLLLYVTGPAIIDHVSANYAKLYFCQYLQLTV